jgi:hypothetical protein
LIPTGGFGEPLRWPGELVGPGVEGLAFGVALGVVGVGLGVSVGTAGTGEMAEFVAGCGADDATDAWVAAADDPAAELAAADPAASELTNAELRGVWSVGFVDVLQAASAERAAITTTIWVRRAVLVRRAIPHAATPGPASRRLIT